MNSKALMVINKGFRPNRCLVLICVRASKERAAKMLKRTPNAAQWNSQAIPQRCFATGQYGPGSACGTEDTTLDASEVPVVDNELDMARDGVFIVRSKLCELAQTGETSRNSSNSKQLI